jgi:hypothetical protein
MSSGTTNIDELPNNDNNVKMEVNDNNNVNNQIPQLSQEDLNKIISGIQSASTNNMTTLPSRDIPNNQNEIIQDPQIQPNYIPTNNNNEDYINNDKTIDEIIDNNIKNKEKKQKINDLQDELQTPILIIILFFLFQLPIINKQLFLYLPSLFIKDGNMNFIGYLVKSLLFGGFYYGLMKLINYIN